MENGIYSQIKNDFDKEANDGIFTKDLTECDRLSIQYLSGIIKPEMEVLEIGCGKCNVLEAIPGKRTGIDLSPEMLKECSIKNKQEGNMDALPYENETFDLVYMIMTFQQSQDREKTLSEMKRVTKKGGTMIIIDGDKDSGIGQERERQIKVGTWKMVGKAQWLSAKDFPDWKVNHLKDHILCLKKTIGQ